MRLTLRTLLAYLDNTLEPQDAESLRQKIAESGFATQLVQRIRTTVSRNVSPAPSPHAVGPLDDPNVMGEFLDSTLPAEQVAEIERACLESDPLLAEAAACHQILTVILAQPAEVSEQLRQRIYELPSRNVSDVATAGSFSSLTIPPANDRDESQDIPISDRATVVGKPTGGSPPVAATDPPTVKPVGVNDSGVSDAPTRLRQAEAASSIGKREPAIAGSKPRSTDDTRIYGGSIRPSRIAPWLVSLGLVAVLLFALYQIFEPILNQTQQVAQETNQPLDGEESPTQDDSFEPLPRAEESGAIEADNIDNEVGREPGTVRPESPESTPETDDVIIASDTPDVEIADPAEDTRADNAAGDNRGTEISEPTGAASSLPGMTASIDGSVAAGDGVEPSEIKPSASGDSAKPSPTESGASLGDGVASETIPAEDSVDVADVAPPIPTPMESDQLPTEGEEGDANNVDSAADDQAQEPVAVAKIASEETLLIARQDEAWVQLNMDDEILAGQPFVVPPGFRVSMVTAQSKWTFIGPAQGKWILEPDGATTFDLAYGKLVCDPVEPKSIASLTIGEENLKLVFNDNVETQAAVEVEFDRQPGLDPREPENRVASIEVYAFGESIQLISNNDTMTVPAGQKWIRQGTAIADLQTVESPLEWLEPTDEAQPSLQRLARNGLLALIEDADSLQIALREATLFRRAEVAALAAQTLLQLGFGDVYFGGDGILSEIKQRIYWPDHYKALMSHVNRSAESATSLRDSIAKMDSANATAIFQLLTGFSQRQLVEGADERLLVLLDSSSTAVRVLALETLREITGTTLNFRPEEDNEVRRTSGIRKWEVRQRKGDIRWQP